MFFFGERDEWRGGERILFVGDDFDIGVFVGGDVRVGGIWRREEEVSLEGFFWFWKMCNWIVRYFLYWGVLGFCVSG